MKKYRYADPGKLTTAHRLRGYAMLFIGWNLLGYGAWKLLSTAAAKRDPEWENRPQGERIALATGADPTTVQTFQFSFTSSEKEENQS